MRESLFHRDFRHIQPVITSQKNNMDESLRKKPDQELTWNEHIRKRPGMYLGQVNHKGFVDRLKTLITQICDAANSDLVQVIFKDQNIGILKFKNLQNNLREDIGVIDRNYTHNRIDLPTLNALSSNMKISFKGEVMLVQVFKFGSIENRIGERELKCNELEIEFELDRLIWGEEFNWNSNYLSYELREFCYLNPKIKFEITDVNEQESNTNTYHFKNGLSDRLEIEILNAIGTCYFKHSINYKTENFDLQAAFAFRQYAVDKNFIRTYVNNEITTENGSHLDGLLKGLTYGVMTFFQANDLVNDYKISEKGMKEGLVCMINIKMDNALFSGCVKNKLANSEIIEPIANHVSEELYKSIQADNESTQKLIDKFKIGNI